MKWVRDHGLILFFLAFWLLAWGGLTILDWHRSVAEAAEHGESLGVKDWLVDYGALILEGWHGEALQNLTMIVFGALLYARIKGHPSPESRDAVSDQEAQ